MEGTYTHTFASIRVNSDLPSPGRGSGAPVGAAPLSAQVSTSPIYITRNLSFTFPHRLILHPNRHYRLSTRFSLLNNMTSASQTVRELKPGVWAPIPTFFDAEEELGES